MFKTLDEVKEYVKKNNSQSHLAICNTNLFSGCIQNGIYGFPHQGTTRKKSFWRAAASLYNIGNNDLIFLYRTNGEDPGCKEIHGPFKIKVDNGSPALFYDLNSTHYPIKVNNTTDCKVRFLFEPLTEKVYSIRNNYELIKKFESKDIWGYRHPSVMNIGAARKKSVTSYTKKQTLVILDLMTKFGAVRHTANKSIPLEKHVKYYNNLTGNESFRFDDEFLMDSNTNDEAYLYSYILRGLKTQYSSISQNLVEDFDLINQNILGFSFLELTNNALLEAIISPHLQDELDIVLTDATDSTMLLMEIKNNHIDQLAINQTTNYLELLSAIFPERKVYANIVGTGIDSSLSIPKKYHDIIKLVKYSKENNNLIRFSELDTVQKGSS